MTTKKNWRLKYAVLSSTFVAATIFSGIGNAQVFNSLPKEASLAAQSITEAMIYGPTRFLSSDLLEGRLPGSNGDALTKAYIASEFETIGLQPIAMKGSWFQEFDLVGITTQSPSHMDVRKGDSKVTLRHMEDVILNSGLQTDGAVDIKQAELVFVGYGITAPEYQWDDYKDVDTKGKILVYLNNDPASDPALFGGKTRLYYGRWSYKYEIAAKKKALGAIIIHTTESAGYPWKVVQNSFIGEKLYLPHKPEETLPVMGWVTDSAMKKIIEASGKKYEDLLASAEKRDFKPVALGATLSTSLKNKTNRVKTANILGVLPGSDPKLKNEYVMYMAHHDHLGICEQDPAKSDRICNGAVDNASGVASILAIARTMSSLKVKPRRSILFAAVGAEEQGLLGSEYFAKYPVVQPGRISAAINIDGVSIFGRTKDITVIGKGKSNIDKTLEKLAKQQNRVLHADAYPEKGFFYRSDQLNTAKIGIPSAYFRSGEDVIGRPEGWGKSQKARWESDHYHQVSDEVRADWNLAGALEDIQLCFALGFEIANHDRLAQWNAGDEFELVRMQSLQELQTLKAAP